VHVRGMLLLATILATSVASWGAASAQGVRRGPPQPGSSPPAASMAVVRWATHWRAQAAKNRLALDRARACFGLRPLARPPVPPSRAASGSEWTAWGRACKRLAVRYHRSFAGLRYRMAHPARVTSAATWRPLVRWYWPASQVEYALVIMRRESGGRPSAYNPSGCAGLFQVSRYWYSSKWHFDPFDPEQNVKHAAMVWRLCGWHAWVTAW